MINFLTFIRRIYLLILQKIFLIYETLPVGIMHCFLRNRPFMAHYIRDVLRDRGAGSVSEVQSRIFFLSFSFNLIRRLNTSECLTLSSPVLSNAIYCFPRILLYKATRT